MHDWPKYVWTWIPNLQIGMLGFWYNFLGAAKDRTCSATDFGIESCRRLGGSSFQFFPGYGGGWIVGDGGFQYLLPFVPSFHHYGPLRMFRDMVDCIPLLHNASNLKPETGRPLLRP